MTVVSAKTFGFLNRKSYSFECSQGIWLSFRNGTHYLSSKHYLAFWKFQYKRPTSCVFEALRNPEFVTWTIWIGLGTTEIGRLVLTRSCGSKFQTSSWLLKIQWKRRKPWAFEELKNTDFGFATPARLVLTRRVADQNKSSQQFVSQHATSICAIQNSARTGFNF